MNTYYHPGDADEIEGMLRDGFIDDVEEIDDTDKVYKIGVYVADAPEAPNPIIRMINC